MTLNHWVLGSSPRERTILSISRSSGNGFFFLREWLFIIFVFRQVTMIKGIISLVVVGMSWSLTGVVMGAAPKKKIDPASVQLTGTAISIICCTLLLCFYKGPQAAPAVLFWCGLSYFLSGMLNCIMLIIMSRAMQNGPNGIIWAIIQSAMIFPFLTGIMFFGVKANLLRISGMILMLVSLLLSGLSRPNRSTGTGRWKMAAFTAFILTGFIHNLSNIPSYFESVQQITPVFRTLTAASGAFVTAFSLLVFQKKTELYIENAKSKWLWIFSVGLQFFGLIFAICLLYPGMDQMAKCGAGSLSYPLLVSSCLIGFFLYSLFILREKNTLLQYISMCCCLAGIILICL